MTTRVHSDLRRLALAYYRGWIPRDKYLSIRKDYLQAITNDEIPAAIDPKKIAPPPRKKSTAVTSTKPKSTNWIIIAFVIVAIALLALLGYLLTSSDEPELKPVSTATETSIETETPAVIAEPEEPHDVRFITYLQENFLGEDSAWNHETLNNLKLKWLALSQDEQELVRQSGAFADFSSSLVQRIVDERSLNNIVPTDYELALMTMAKNIGVINQIPE